MSSFDWLLSGWTSSTVSRRRRCARTTVRVEWLETRSLLTVDLSPAEQLLLELVNRARANPDAEATRQGLTSLNQGLPAGRISSAAKPPIAPNQLLQNAARAYSQDMFNRNFFDHTDPDGRNPGNRIAAVGYPSTFWGENISLRGTWRGDSPSPSDVEDVRNDQQIAEGHHDQLFLSPGHRENILRLGFREMGMGNTINVRPSNGIIDSHLTQLFADRTGNAFLLGVVFADRVRVDDFYSIGEGRGGVTITARAGTGQEYTTTTATAGGFVLRLPAGTYTVIASGGGLSAPMQFTGVTMTSDNRKVDFKVTDLVRNPPTGAQDQIGTLRVLQEGPAAKLFPAGRITQGTETSLDGATLTLTMNTPDAGDRFSVEHRGTGAGQVGVSGANITFGGTTIATFSGGGGAALVVTFNAQATFPAVQAVLRSLLMSSVSTTPPSGARTATASLQVASDAPATVTREVEIAARRATSPEMRFYRAYNPNADYHFFTTNRAEFDNAVSAGYRDESLGQQGFAIPTDYVAGASIMHRMYNLSNGRHYYTLSDAERDALVQAGWRFEKDEGYMFTSSGSGRFEVFRLYNRSTGVHLYTENSAVKDAILAAYPGIWEQHDSLGFAAIWPAHFAFALPESESAESPMEPGGSPAGTEHAVSLVALPPVAPAAITSTTASPADDLFPTAVLFDEAAPAATGIDLLTTEGLCSALVEAAL